MRKIRAHRGIMFLLPSLIGFAVFFILPFCISIGYSFLDKPVGGTFVGLKNFTDLFTNRTYLLGLTNTFKFIAIAVPLGMALSLLLALTLFKMPRHREVCSLLILVPLVIPSGSMVFFWKTFFGYDGVINGVLFSMGIEKVNWLGMSTALFVMVLIYLWKNLGYSMVLYLAGRSNIPQEYYEAASVDGAGRWQVFRWITFPHLAATSVLVFMMSIINSFKVFREIYLITGSYPHESIYTLQHFMNNMFASLNYPRLTTATTVLVAIIALMTQVLIRLERRTQT